jgi:replicative DNA helicase
MTELFNNEAESFVLGFLLDPSEYTDKVWGSEVMRLRQLLTPDHFEHAEHKVIFDVIKTHDIRDKIILWDKLSSDKKYKAVSSTTIAKLPSACTFVSLKSYVDIIIDKYQKRQMFEFGQEIQNSMLEGNSQFEVALKAQAILTSMASKQMQVASNQELLEEVLNEQPGDVLSSGYKLIDKFIGGYARGMLITVAGDSGHLKTTLALDKAFKMAELNPAVKIGIFSKEMLATDLMKKQISRICQIPISKIFSQEYDKEFVKSRMMEIPAWRENRVKIVNPNSFTGVADIAKIQLANNFDVWFLDFIQLLEFSKAVSNSSDYNIQIGQNMRNLQSLALATKSVGIILSQVKKGIEQRKNKKPTISDIEWSGLIKQLSSYIFFSYYPGKYYGFDQIPENYYYLIAEKTRFAENFIYPMDVDPSYGEFKELLNPEDRLERVNKLRSIVD